MEETGQKYYNVRFDFDYFEKYGVLTNKGIVIWMDEKLTKLNWMPDNEALKLCKYSVLTQKVK